jgi:transposase
MKPYSEDLRERVVAAVAGGQARKDVVVRFEVSLATVERWIRLKQETGRLTPKPVPGPPAVKMGPLQAALPEQLTARPTATLAELCAWWRERSGVAVSTATMSRTISRLDWTRKKSR